MIVAIPCRETISTEGVANLFLQQKSCTHSHMSTPSPNPWADRTTCYGKSSRQNRWHPLFLLPHHHHHPTPHSRTHIHIWLHEVVQTWHPWRQELLCMQVSQPLLSPHPIWLPSTHWSMTFSWWPPTTVGWMSPHFITSVTSKAQDNSLISYRYQGQPSCPHNGQENHTNWDDHVDHPRPNITPPPTAAFGSNPLQ